MVWIDNYAIPRQYFPTLTEARKAAIAWLDAQGGRIDQVFFYPSKGSRDYGSYVLKETINGNAYYSWHHNTKAYGMVSEPLYKNGKIDRRS